MKSMTKKRKDKTMRQKLKEIGNQTRERYAAVIGRCGIKFNAFKNFPERTFVMKDVIHVNTGEIVTDKLNLIKNIQGHT